MPRIFVVIGLQIVALFLASIQFLTGIRTDEAKYLLNIPYPHPPLVRSVLGWTDWFLYQEIFWRIIFATLLIQATWLVWDMGRSLRKPSRMLLAGTWVLSSGVVLQAGSLYMSSLTALHILLFLYFYERKEFLERWPVVVGILWLGTLFTAYQGILLFPLVFALLLRMRGSRAERIAYFAVPVGFLCIYSLTNPLVLASMVAHGSRDLSSGILPRILGTSGVWALGGSVVVSIIGTLGLLRSRNFAASGTFLLICAYVALSRYDYYMILFTPLCVYGVREVLRQFPQMGVRAASCGALLLFGMLVVTVRSQGIFAVRDEARRAMRFLTQTISSDSTVLMKGSFGHQWQYESPFSLRRYREELLPSAGAVVCLEECEKPKGKWKEEEVDGVKVYVKL